ncbi:hypothetical protein H6P81_000084 [Aristolochia fimbriata]|uniref:Uncharacterized protein n=1 Tax=Aristolochia fimbriata TaxID=158543 RepID=A0AAV7F626_ARIFI|nr:hypothetical protein H6P81_000084 [Aristolochia fimbriata]
MSVKEGREVARAKPSTRFDRCFSGLNLSVPIEAGGLKDLDSDKLKTEIKRWARAVVTKKLHKIVIGRFLLVEGSTDELGQIPPEADSRGKANIAGDG